MLTNPWETANLLSAEKILAEKTRINLYVPKKIVAILDYMAKESSRGKFVTKLVLQAASKLKAKPPYGLFSPLNLSETELNLLTAQWGKAVHEKT